MNSNEENLNQAIEPSSKRKKFEKKFVPVEEKDIKICIYFCEKKKRQCKFNALKNCEYCTWHDSFNLKNDNVEKRVPCPLDPKHSVYEKNLESHLKKCNSKIKSLGDFDVKNINLCEKDEISSGGAVLNNPLDLGSITTYKELNEDQMKKIVEFLISLDEKFNLYNLQFEKLQNDFFDEIISQNNEKLNKHIRQIGQIVDHVNSMVPKDGGANSICLVELGAGRGKLSYWFEQSRLCRKASESNSKANFNILLIERGSQRYKFDSLMKKDMEETNAKFDRIRIDLKDLFLNEVPLIKKSDRYILYGKHLCGCATDFSLRCLKNSIENSQEDLKFIGFVLAVCCHHKCEWNSFCGSDFLKKANIDEKLFNIIRSISSWSTSGQKNNTPPPEFVHGHNRYKLGKICKNLFDMARIDYIKNNIKLPVKYCMKTKLFNYIETDVTLENTMIYVKLEKIKENFLNK